MKGKLGRKGKDRMGLDIKKSPHLSGTFWREGKWRRSTSEEEEGKIGVRE